MTMMSGMNAGAESEWKPAPAPLSTKWAKDVSPGHARPEYPRPLMVRKEWKSLNGIWQFAFDDSNGGAAAGWASGKDLPERILVPFTFEASLSGIGKGKEIHEHIWYRKQFEVPGGWTSGGKRVILHFGAVDWHAAVYVNGKPIGEHTGGYSPFSFDVTEALSSAGPQELVVSVYDPADPKGAGYQPKGKQLGSSGIWYTRTTGIWQSVWLEPVAAAHITRLQVDSDIEKSTLNVHVDVSGSEAATAHVQVSRSGKTVASGTAELSESGTVVVHVESPDLWSPESPALYDLTVSLKRGSNTLDTVQSYSAFRHVEIQNGRLTLNGKPYFYRGVLDQGYWPDGILTAPTDEAIKSDVELVKKLGFNLARKHVKIEDPRWYYWCDHLGVAVWQDMPSSHNLSSQEAKNNFTAEWKSAMETVRGYPCVVQWIPFNENWGDPGEFQDEIVKLTRTIDSTRPITDASGWTQRGLTDVIDAHDYGNNLLAQGVANPVKPKVVGEFGGIALPVRGHTWTTGWGYQTAKDAEGLVRRICYQTTQLYEAANLSGFVYTQLTDVEQELNGLVTYDRQPKADFTHVAADFMGVSRATRSPAITNWLVLGPIPTGTAMKSAEDTPANRAIMDQIMAKEYVRFEAQLHPDENSPAAIGRTMLHWKAATASDGNLNFIKIFGDQPEKSLENAVVYAVAYLDSKMDLHNVTLLMGSDDGARVWLNGKLISTVSKLRGVTIDEDVIEGLTLKAGRNVLVVKVGQGTGGWGLTARIETPDAASK